jgi:3-oxoacyl-[acyl-carrier protein] reductase
MTFAGLNALVTGAASGIGLASARLLAVEGATVVFADRDLGAALGAADAVGARAMHVDVADRGSVDAMVADCGGVDVLVHCAAVGPNGPALELTDEDWRRVLATNLDGTFFVTQAVARGMVERRRGAIVLLASDRATTGMRAGAAYAASKGGVIAYAKSLALELGAHGVTVNVINPGTTDTPMARSGTSDAEWAAREERDPLGRLSLPAEIAQMVVFLASPERAFMTGQVVSMRMREV